MTQYMAEVRGQKQLSPDYYELSFSWKGVPPQPGQFLTVKCWEESAPLLRRPFAFSAFSAEKSEASIIYQKRGHGTKRMTTLNKGDSLDVLGPLGNPFPEASCQSPSLIGGGIGTGPILFLANSLKRKGLSPRLILGFRNAELVPELAMEEGLDLFLCTDDGSKGFKGNVVDFLNKEPSSVEAIYSCGPHPMLKGCHLWAVKHNILCYVSVEEIMACGIGACQGCAIPVHHPREYFRVCKDGPVFESRIIKWT